jgi:hypothetical protein
MIDMSSFLHIVNLQSPDTSLLDAVPMTDKPLHYRLLPKSMLEELSFKSSPNKKEEQFYKSAYFKSRSPVHKLYANSELRAFAFKVPPLIKSKTEGFRIIPRSSEHCI